MTRSWWPALLVATMVLPLAAASWRAPGQLAEEPSTAYDTGQWMFTDPAWGYDTARRVYLNVFLAPVADVPGVKVGRFHAYFGVWKDCDGDGGIGLAGAADGYRAELLSLLVGSYACPASSDPRAHNDGETVHELLWIGPGSSDLADADAKIWVDWGAPAAAGEEATPKRAPDDVLDYVDDAQGARWIGRELWPIPPDLAAYATARASLGPASLSIATLPSGGASGVYGAEQCAAWTYGVSNGWVCDPARWSGVPVGTEYQLRDVDCHTAWGPAFAACE